VTPRLGVVVGICAVVVVITWQIFGQTVAHDFVKQDYEIYVYDNPKVAAGHDWEIFAFTHTHTLFVLVGTL
jgi:hypothetical protein